MFVWTEPQHETCASNELIELCKTPDHVSLPWICVGCPSVFAAVDRSDFSNSAGNREIRNWPKLPDLVSGNSVQEEEWKGNREQTQQYKIQRPYIPSHTRVTRYCKSRNTFSFFSFHFISRSPPFSASFKPRNEKGMRDWGLHIVDNCLQWTQPFFLQPS